jgi:uncharacterized protein
MADPITINLRHLARGLGIPLRQIEAVVELLDEGNTVPFITRYRKDQTGGLDEEQIRQIQSRLTKQRLLTDRKQTILRSIESQGKLTEALTKQIVSANTTKRLEDLYLPFKPKKQTLATAARSRGLELLAAEILAGTISADALDARAADFANPDRQIPTAADALLGAGHILAEQFSENAELRHLLREILQRTGKITCSQIVAESKPEKPAEATAGAAATPQENTTAPAAAPAQSAATQEPAPQPSEAADVEPSADLPSAEAEAAPEPAESVVGVNAPAVADEIPPASEPASNAPVEAAAEAEPVAESAAAADSSSTTISPPEIAASPAIAPVESIPAPVLPAAGPKQTAKQLRAEQKRQKKELKKKKLEERKQKAFSDYYSYGEEIKRIPPHRVLAINRGERAKVLRVKTECDFEAMYKAVDDTCLPPDHPHAEFLRGCARDALNRLILPSLEREVRRELTERAETHAVGVFARNLRNLLLQPPVRDRRVLAVDPGFKSGCKLVALDQFGNILGHELVFLIGKPERRQEARKLVVDLIDRFQLSVIVIGNGTACRETEDFFAEMLGEELKDKGVAYVIVNEAGASVYSTSRLGREEFPSYDASLRGAISIGRRLQDPLSELVKIEAASIGVGLYQHDVKAKHLQESLDEVVESCVNYVGVDVNTASPALLRYVSGLNQLTARRVYEYRMENGPFRSREQLKSVPGFGDATFVQSAGFLKIVGGDNPLDAGWIHPESYEIALRVLAKFGCTTTDLASKETAVGVAEKLAQVDTAALSGELQVGTMLLKDILAQLVRPGRDPREDLPPPVFKQGVLKLEDLAPGMELTGTVLNVVDFGAFVDIGMHDSGLVHVSQLADKFIRDPHEIIAVGDIVKVWVLEVDKQRRRVSLTMIPPGQPRTQQNRHGRPAESHPRGERPPRPPRAEGAGNRSEGRAAGQQPAQGQSSQRRNDRPRFDRRSDDQPRGRGRPGDRGDRPVRPPAPPKPVTPLTDEMKNGKAPLRSFGDLMQFFGLQQPTPPSKKNDGRNKSKDRRPKENRSADESRSQGDVPEKGSAPEVPGSAEPPPSQPAADSPSDVKPEVAASDVALSAESPSTPNVASDATAAAGPTSEVVADAPPASDEPSADAQ